MKKFAWLLAGVLLAGCGNHGQSGSAAVDADTGGGTALKLNNPGFEEAMTDDSVPGWLFVQHAGVKAYKVMLDPDHAYAGKDSVSITRTEPQVYGALIQRVHVSKFVGRTVELSAMLRCKDVGPGGFKLLLNGDRPKTQVYSPALTGAQDWKRETIRLKLPVGVQTLTVGVTLLDAGTGWADDVKLRVLD